MELVKIQGEQLERQQRGCLIYKVLITPQQAGGLRKRATVCLISGGPSFATISLGTSKNDCDGSEDTEDP